MMITKFYGGKDIETALNRARADYDKKRVDVKEIISKVRLEGDRALFEYTEKFDKFTLSKDNIEVGRAEIDAAYKCIGDKTLDALRRAKDNISKFHSRNLPKTSIVKDGDVTTGSVIKPVARAGIYVPGGNAAYPSTVLMCAVPAAVAGVREIIMTTPGKNINPLTLIAANECGVKRIFRIGGAQAIAAMAYGTESVPSVNVISGPGNIYVALAKREVYGQVGIDMIAGPSEILIVADETANPKFVAADMLSQAEHDVMAMSTLITTSEDLADKVIEQLAVQIEKLPKKETARLALKNYGAVIVSQTLNEAFMLANRIAPEHLELCVENAESYLDRIESAGAVFLGNYSPEPLGDYYAGPNHVLPTGGTAHYASSLGVENYLKRINVIQYGEKALKKVGRDIIDLAQTEELQAHANAIKIRTEAEE